MITSVNVTYGQLFKTCKGLQRKCQLGLCSQWGPCVFAKLFPVAHWLSRSFSRYFFLYMSTHRDLMEEQELYGGLASQYSFG
jgi:hypothetical protein